MDLRVQYLTNNDCYKAYVKHTVKGIMVHSTGANNPYLWRYVAPDDGIIGENKYGTHWNQPRPSGQGVCVHAFIGKDKNGNVRTYQTLPWEIKCWGCGSGKNGSGNNGYVQFEICEDDLKDVNYFNKVYREAIELCVYLCKKFNLTEKDIIDHSEGYKLGIASNHGDVKHWFSKHGKSMDTFRADVKKELDASNANQEVVKVDPVVLDLQKKLNALKIAKLVEDGIMGKNTKNALMKFQTITRATVTGEYDQNTKFRLNEIWDRPIISINRGSATYATMYIQWRLGISNDGIFGKQTKGAVEEFQRKNKLVVDGIVGNNTWKALIG